MESKKIKKLQTRIRQIKRSLSTCEFVGEATRLKNELYETKKQLEDAQYVMMDVKAVRRFEK